MSPYDVDASPEQVLRALRALGGEATLGDLAAVTGLSNVELESSIDALIATGRGHVRVREHGDLTFHAGGGKAMPVRGAHRGPSRAEHRRTITDRKVLRVIRERAGVLSLAELVEQTGLTLSAAEAEMERLAARWGGDRHLGLDGHAVYAFPGFMPTVHGRFAGREPRPAWARTDDPMDHGDRHRRRARAGAAALVAAGGVGLAAGAALLLGPLSTPVLAAATLLAGTLAAVGAREILHHHPRYRFRQPETLRRYALGVVVETALRGKGVVSLDRTVRILQARAGGRRVSRAGVERALRALAAEFGAPITKQGSDLFFGFRTVKRHFLASHLLRREFALARIVAGETVFDTADPRDVATRRELDAFDRELLGPPPGGP